MQTAQADAGYFLIIQAAPLECKQVETKHRSKRHHPIHYSQVALC
jgi:hypothetical protein